MKTEQRTIGEHVYTCTQMPAFRGIRVFTRLAKLIGEPLLQFTVGAAERKGKTTSTELVYAASQIFAELDETVVEQTIRDLFVGSMRCDSIKGVDTKGDFEVIKAFDVHFSGRILHLLAVVQFALEVNFADFFDVLPLTLGASEGSKEEPAG